MLINIRDIIYKRTGKLLPRWISRPLEKLIHQDELNEIWATGKELSAPEFLRHTLNYLNVECEVHYTAPLADDERYIFASNHPFGGMDGPGDCPGQLQELQRVSGVHGEAGLHGRGSRRAGGQAEAAAHPAVHVQAAEPGQGAERPVDAGTRRGQGRLGR